MSNPRTIRLARSRPAECGVALVTTVIVVAVLAVVAVAFMQSVTTDRLSARISKEYMQARLAADAGAAMAQSMVAGLITRYPDSATVWQNIGGGAGGVAGTNNEVTVLYVRAQTNDLNRGARPGQFGGEVALRAQPLISRTGTTTEQINTNLVSLTNLASFLPFNTNTMVNLNATNLYRPDPLIGSRGGVAPVTAAQWIYLTMNGGATNATNPAIARYAFWVEDESFKVNVNVATNGPRGNTSLGLSAAEARLDGAWGATNNNAALRSADAGEVISARTALGGRFPTASTAAVPAGLSDATAADELRFLTTANSAGLDLSRGGFKRFNINSITNGISGPADTNNIRTNLNRVIAAITNSNSVPNFGQRFYRLGASVSDINATDAVSSSPSPVEDNHTGIYLQKIAANILDYIDSDNQPTVINSDAGFSIRVGRPTDIVLPKGGGLEGPNALAAVGVENVPFLYGYAAHARLKEMNPVGFNTTNNPPPLADRRAQFRFTVDHYLEFWNMGTRPIEFGSGNEAGVDYIPNAFVKIANAPGWGTSSSGQPELQGFDRGDRDHETEVSNGTRIAPGASVLFTTAPEDEARKVAPTATQIVSLSWPAEQREFSGETRYVVTATNSGLNLNRLYAVRRAHSTRQGNALDGETEILLGNNAGLIQSFPFGTVTTRNLMVTNSTVLDSDRFFLDRSRLRGARPGPGSGAPNPGDPRSQEGDPRTLNEQLEILPYKVGGADVPDQSRFFTDVNNEVLGQPNTRWVDAAAWVDTSSMSAGAANAPMILANQGMQSIGELGHLVDPARPLAEDPAGAEFSRGGGRTLRVGQSEHRRWFDGNQTNASRTWTSWRLADIFTTTAASNNATALDAQGNLTNALGVVRGATNASGVVLSIPGLINPNGLLRDNGAALQAVLQGLTYLPISEGGVPGLTGRSLTGLRLNSFVNTNIFRLTNATAAGLPAGALNPFWERGEISESPIFNTGSIPANMATTFDRGREELVRRTIEMITTRGSVFTVYAVGQTLQGTNVTGTARLKQTFQIEPQFAGAASAFNDAFAPNAVGIGARFRPPTNYTTRVLQTSYD